MADRRDFATVVPAVVLTSLAVFGIAGCGAPTTQLPQNNSSLGTSHAPQVDAGGEEALLQAQRACMTAALNNTLYRRQTDNQLDAALFSQDLGRCPTDFLEGFVRLRNTAREYVGLNRELTAHRNREGQANDNDDTNLLCSLIVGEQCAPWETGRWRDENTELTSRISAKRSELDSARANVETLIARYGLYVTEAAPPISNLSLAGSNML